jgi:hypothetical protein
MQVDSLFFTALATETHSDCECPCTVINRVHRSKNIYMYTTCIYLHSQFSMANKFFGGWKKLADLVICKNQNELQYVMFQR